MVVCSVYNKMMKNIHLNYKRHHQTYISSSEYSHTQSSIKCSYLSLFFFVLGRYMLHKFKNTSLHKAMLSPLFSASSQSSLSLLVCVCVGILYMKRKESTTPTREPCPKHQKMDRLKVTLHDDTRHLHIKSFFCTPLSSEPNELEPESTRRGRK